MSKKQQVNFRIDTDLLEALKYQAEVEGTSYTDLIQRLCWQGLKGSSNSSTIQPAIQSDILKEQLKAELREELGQYIDSAFKNNVKPITEERQALLGE